MRRYSASQGALCLLWILLPAHPAAAQAPFYTDDTGVTDLGLVHVEMFDEVDALQSSQYPDFRQNTVNFKVNVGLPGRLEFDIDAPFISIDRTAGARSARGIGDTNFGLKWQLPPPSSPTRPTFAVSFYTEMPTGNARQELGSGLVDYWLNLIAQLPTSEQTRFNVNMGILFAGNTTTGVVGVATRRGQVYTGGLSCLHDVSSRFTLGAEIYGGIADTNGLNRSQLQSMLGAQYTIHDGTMIFLGLIAGTYSASPTIGGQIGIAVDVGHLFHASDRPAQFPALAALGASRARFYLPDAGDLRGL